MARSLQSIGWVGIMSLILSEINTTRRLAIINMKNSKIKVIKRADAATGTPATKKVKAEKGQGAREMVATVKNWVADLQSKKRAETKTAIKMFLAAKPQAGEA